MRPFLDWLDEDGFHTKTVWDVEKKKWIGPGLIQFFEFQRRILGHCFTPDQDGNLPYSTVVYSTIKKSGKALALDTPIPTPLGWTTMGELGVGDEVFDESGVACRVSYVTEVMTDHPCYRVDFSNGESIVADAEHQWYVRSRLPVVGSKITGPQEHWAVMTTEQMAKSIMPTWGQARNYSIQVARALQLPEVDLPVPPYTFGSWLGDGNSDCAIITVGYGDEEVLDYIRAEGVPVSEVKHSDRAPRYSLTNRSLQKKSVGTALRDMEVLHNKHIPQIYLRASYTQRLELLRGLMDTDGYVSVKGRCEFTSTCRTLADGVMELLSSLGIKARMLEKKAMLNGRYVGQKYRIHFQAYTDQPVFKMKRKIERMVDRKRELERSGLVRITDITPMESVPVRCIQVDSSSHLYLVGRSMIPTHNTQLEAVVLAWAAETAPDGSELYMIANDIDQAQARAFSDIIYHVEHKFGYEPNRYRIDYENGTYLQAIAQHYASAAGARQYATGWDELWGYMSEKSRRMWSEMTPPPSVPNSFRFIATYAGFENESDQLLELYNMCFKEEGGEYINGEVVPELADIVDSKGRPVCRRNGDVFIYWDHEPRLPWQTPEYYASQMMTLRPADFLRMHRNQWVASTESFIPIELWERAERKLQGPLTLFKDHPYRAYPISVGIDIGMKHDCSALVGVYYDGGRRKAGLAFHYIWTPPKDGTMLDLEFTVEMQLLKLWQEFKIVSVLYDPAQFQRSSITLARKGIPMIEFTQTAGNMTLATQAFYDVLKTDNLEAYPDPEFKDHVRYASAETTARGFRLVKGKNAKYKIDAAIALAMGIYDAVNRGGVDTSDPVRIISPFADASGIYIPTIGDMYQAKLPAALRD